MSTTADAIKIPQSGSLQDAVEAHTTVATAGSILVRNEGGYVARFSVSYNLNGQDFTKDSGNFTLGVNASISIPAGATNIRLKVEEMWGFGWSTIFHKSYAEPLTICFKIYGTTLDPKYAEISC
jgi:P pilus assembly chaperone PapD